MISYFTSPSKDKAVNSAGHVNCVLPGGKSTENTISSGTLPSRSISQTNWYCITLTATLGLPIVGCDIVTGDQLMVTGALTTGRSPSQFAAPRLPLTLTFWGGPASTCESLTSSSRSEERRVGKECRSRWST